jgi:hypothetical protein
MPRTAEDVVRHPSGVVLTNAKFLCTGCGKWKLGSEVGLRKMADGTVRNQAQCTECRSKYRK